MNTTPRNAALLATAVALGLLAAGCGSGTVGPVADTGPGRAAETGSPALGAAERLGRDDLELALLDIGDLPSGWAPDTAKAAEERGIGVPEPDGRQCGSLFDKPSDEWAENRFARTEVGPFVVARAHSWQNAEAAEKALEEFREAAEECESFEVEEGPSHDRTRVGYTAERLRMPELGDESVALRFVREGPGDEETTVLADVVSVRLGAAGVHLAQAGVDDEDATGIGPLVRTAVDKLDEVVSDGTPEPTGSFPDVTRLNGDPYPRRHD
ncbi:hypothetical protein MTQ01_07775 [Streptomyces sp. XM4193]|uniref:hypothetical protein n=1 Tax=Streptomyces sp. XM4193 TaxID=2929782 RepID=UPI001FFA2654|nr:hypothetical protein [Streptomyces sp. XM4193]MCK1795902.1 hypothetical protein [Streptomyces sp. XM4193]